MEFTHWLATQAVTPALNQVMQAIAQAGLAIAEVIGQGALQGVTEKSSTTNVQGETQMQLDIASHAMAMQQFEASGVVAGVVSEEAEQPLWLNQPQAPYLVCMDPLDGSSNLAINGVVGSIFAIIPHDGRAHTESFLQPGHRQVAAAYVMYGPATLLVCSLGQGTHVFTLDPSTKQFFLTQSHVSIPAHTSEFAINASNQRYWQPAVQRYIHECLQGASGPRGRDFNMRWCASMVMDVHRVLTRGGVFLYPQDQKLPVKAGRLRLLYEANPMSFLVTQAGGYSMTGEQSVLDVVPNQIHQRVPVMLGAQDEIQILSQYHQLDRA